MTVSISHEKKDLSIWLYPNNIWSYLEEPMALIKPKENIGPYHGGGEPRYDWEGEVKGLLKAELARRNMRYPDLVKRLAGVGVTDNEANLRNKISRGNFSAVFLVQCLMAIGV